jgi:NO-binding membrane sensor protein with MHYT domain
MHLVGMIGFSVLGARARCHPSVTALGLAVMHYLGTAAMHTHGTQHPRRVGE